MRSEAICHNVTAAAVNLSDLAANWIPCGQKVAAVRGCVSGGLGITASEAEEIKRWAKIWSGLDPRIRRLYLVNAADGRRWASAALWSIFRENTIPESWVYRCANIAWLDLYGYRAPIPIIPLGGI